VYIFCFRIYQNGIGAKAGSCMFNTRNGTNAESVSFPKKIVWTLRARSGVSGNI
jgi:hypothetical protein